MRAFSGAILGPSHNILSPTVARIEGEKLYLSSPDGSVEQWRLDRVEVIQVAAGYFEVVAKDRRLALVLDEPEAFGEALEAERRSRPRAELPPTRRRVRHRSSLFVKRPRHGIPSLRLGPLLAVLAAALVIVMAIGSTFGDLIDLSTTASEEAPDLPATEVVVRTFSGAESLTSPSFAVEAPWKVEWSLAGDEGAGARLAISAVSVDGQRLAAGTQQGPGEGEAVLQQGGVFSLDLTSTSGQWSIRVVELVNAESR